MNGSIALALVALCACSYDDSLGRRLPTLGPGHLGIRWVAPIGGIEDDFAQRTLIDEQGNVVITGHAVGTVDLLAPPATLPPQHTVPPPDQIVRGFVTRRSGADGSLMWGATFDAGVQSIMHGVAADADGNVYACVTIVDAVGTAPGQTTAGDGFVIKFDPTGHELWRRGFGAGSLAEPWTVAPTDDGGVIVGGRYAGHVDVGDGLQTNSDVYTGSLQYDWAVGDAFLVAYDSSGTRLWGHTITGTGGQTIDWLVRTSHGDIVALVQVASGSAVFGDATFTAATDEWTYVLARYTADGELIGARRIDPVAGTWMFARLARDRANQLVLVGDESRDATDYISIRIFDERGIEVRSSIRERPIEDLAGIAENGMVLTSQHANVKDHDNILTVFDEHAVVLGDVPVDSVPSQFTSQNLELLSGDARDDRVALLGTFDWAVDFGTGSHWAHGAGPLDTGGAQLGRNDVFLAMFDWIPD